MKTILSFSEINQTVCNYTLLQFNSSDSTRDILQPISVYVTDGKLYSLYTTDTKDQWSSYADDSFQSDSSFAYADDTYDYLSTNYRASLGCISHLPTVTVLPSLLQSRNFQFSQNDSTLDVRYEQKLFKEDLFGNYFTLMFYFHWESVPILDPIIILNSSAPIQISKNGILRWSKLSDYEYQDKRISKHTEAVFNTNLSRIPLRYLLGEFNDSVSVNFDMIGESLMETAVSFSLKSSSFDMIAAEKTRILKIEDKILPKIHLTASTDVFLFDDFCKETVVTSSIELEVEISNTRKKNFKVQFMIPVSLKNEKIFTIGQFENSNGFLCEMRSNDDLSSCSDLLCTKISCFQTDDSAWGNPKAPSASRRMRVSFLLTPLCPETEIIFNKSSLTSQISSEVLFEEESFAREKIHIKICNILQTQTLLTWRVILSIPRWLLFGSISLGLTLVALLTLGLYKCGCLSVKRAEAASPQISNKTDKTSITDKTTLVESSSIPTIKVDGWYSNGGTLSRSSLFHNSTSQPLFKHNNSDGMTEI